MISGRTVTLRPANESDRRDIYRWLAESDVTPSMMGKPLFPDSPPPTWDQFNADYAPHLFDGSAPELGGSYVIEVSGQALGQINYEVRDSPVRLAELDVWLRSLADTGHGYGTDAIIALTEHLFCSLGIGTFLIRPSARNPRAVRAYQKAGFEVIPMSYDEQVEAYGAADYADTVVLIKRITA